MRVVEIFESIQSSGYELGKPAMFIKLAGCPYSEPCRVCDVSARGEGKELRLFDILDAIHLPNVIITGCEPILQAQELIETVTVLRDQPRYRNEPLKRAFITVETLGTSFHSELVGLVDFWSLTPNLTSSGHSPDLAVLVEYLAILPLESLEFRISIADQYDLEEAWQLINTLGMRDSRVVLQPSLANQDYINSFCKLIHETFWGKSGWWRIMPRLRILPQLNALAWHHKKRSQNEIPSVQRAMV